MDVVWLDSQDAIDAREVGSKAAGLARVGLLGVPIPPGFVLTVSAFRRFLEQAGLIAQVRQLTMCEEDHQLERWLQDIRAKIELVNWPPALRTSIAESYRSLSTSVAVRSSGIVEDGELSAFAGAYSSFLGRVGEEQVVSAVRSCWSSAFSPSVAAYRLHHHLIAADWMMGVIVQSMVFADKAGVMFTRNPFQDDNTILIQAVVGGCDKIVSGAPADLSLWVDRTNGTLRRVEESDSNPQRFGGGAVGLLGRRVSLRSPHLLRNKEVHALVATGLQLESALGRPQDVEWAFADGEMVVLQTRPLTGRSAG